MLCLSWFAKPSMLLSPRVAVTPFTATRFVCSVLGLLICLFSTKLVAKVPSLFIFLYAFRIATMVLTTDESIFQSLFNI